MHSRMSLLLAASVMLVVTTCVNPTQESITNSLIPLRDGVRLATDIYYPDSKGKSSPVILIRTPYNKNLLEDYGEYYLSKGFIVAIQDVRGKYASEGDWIPYLFEGKDGYDVIEWLASQSWCNGKIGMMGGSYSGSVQLAAAIEKPPHLVTIIPNITPATPFHNTPYENGVFALASNIRWADIVSEDISGQEMNRKFGEVFKTNWFVELDHLPVIDLDKNITGKEIDFWRDWIQHEPIDSYYEGIDYLENMNAIEIPVFLQSGWFDVANRGTKMLYDQLTEAGNEDIKLIVGPWVHSDKASRKLGAIDFGFEADIDLFKIYADWFDYWLKGIDNGIMEEPNVQIFNMGPNRWIFSDHYPDSDYEESKLYLSALPKEKEPRLKGKLTFQLSEIPSFGNSQFIYNPASPTPGFSEFMKKGLFAEYMQTMDTRSDVIIFETGPLEDSMTIAGPIHAVLYASSTAPDTDFSVNLTGIDSEGVVFPIGQTFGIIRAKYRISNKKADPILKGKVYEYTIDLSHTCITLLPGEKLRLEIASCMFPDFSRNLNTGNNNQTSTEYTIAEQTVYHNQTYPSHIVFYSRP